MLTHKYASPPSLFELGLVSSIDERPFRSGNSLPKMKKFRFQLLANWITEQFNPCNVADIAGGKGLLSHLLNQNSFQSTVIDPNKQRLPTKYKDILTNKRIFVTDAENDSIKRLSLPFTKKMGANFDLLIGLHAHGVNMLMIDCVKSFGNQAVILPCCVIDEPSTPAKDENWFMWLVNYAKNQDLQVKFFYLNFSGQNIGFVVKK